MSSQSLVCSRDDVVFFSTIILDFSFYTVYKEILTTSFVTEWEEERKKRLGFDGYSCL